MLLTSSAIQVNWWLCWNTTNTTRSPFFIWLF